MKAPELNTPEEPSQIDSRWLIEKLRVAAEAAQRFDALFAAHIERTKGFAACLERFRASVHLLQELRTAAALAAVEASQNELCIAQELLLLGEAPFSLVEYEPPLAVSDQRIDFRATNEHGVWFVEVKTIRPELIDGWDQYQRVLLAGCITDSATVHFERKWMGGELWHLKSVARARMLEHSFQFEDRILAAGTVSPSNASVLVFFSDGFAWEKDEFEDFVAFYRTGRHRRDDSLAKMEGYAMAQSRQSLRRCISAFGYFARRPFDLAPTESDWDVRPPAEAW